MAGEALVTRPPHLATAVQPTYRTVPPRVAPARTAPLDHTDEMVRPTANPNGSDPVASPYRSDPVARPTPSTGQAPGRMPVWEEGVGYIDDDPTDRRRNPFDF